MPIVEPEILMDGDHTIATTAAVQVCLPIVFVDDALNVLSVGVYSF